MANVKISDLTAASAVADSNQFEINESGTSKRVTASQIKTYLTGSDLDMGGNKVLFANVYSALSDLPNASTYHGMFAHVHATGKGYFAHGGNWIELQNASDTVSASGGAFSGDVSFGGDVGVGLTSPSTKLHVKGDTNQNVMIVDATGTSANYIFDVRDDGTSKFRVDPSGKIGIGTSSPDALTHIYSGASGVTNPHSYTKLHVESADHAAIQLSGSTSGENWVWFAADTSTTPKGGLTYYHGEDYMGFRVNGAQRMRIESDGDLHADGNVIAYSSTISDERLKENIKPIEGALNKVGQLNGYTFTYKADGKQSAGVIAQEVEAVLPSAVTESTLPLKQDDGVEYKTVEYDQLVGLLIEGVKELKAEIEELKNGSAS